MESCFDNHAKCLANSELGQRKVIDALGRSTDKPRMEFCKLQNATIMYIRAVHSHSHGVTINPTLFSLQEIPLSLEEHMSHTGSSSKQKINPGRKVYEQEDEV